MGMTLNRRNIDRFADRLAFDFPIQAQAATSAALNRTAKAAELLAKRNVRRQFTLRNKWTLGSIKSTRTPPTRAIDKQFTMVGSKQAYLATQEFGGALPRTSEGRRITTARGSREGDTAWPRKKVASGRFAPRNIRLHKSPRVRGSKRRRRAVKIAHARRKGHAFVHMDLGNDVAGIFHVQKTKVRMVHRILEKRVRVRASPWLKPAVAKARKTAPIVFRKELERRFRQ